MRSQGDFVGFGWLRDGKSVVEEVKSLKRLFGVAVILAVLASLLVAAPVAAGGPPVVEVRFNGHPVLFDVDPVIRNGRTLVPFRKIFETVGAEVGWDQATRTVTGTRFGKTVKLTIDSTTAAVNGSPATLEVAPTIVGGRTMVPLRFISEALGLQVEYDAASRIANIIDNNWPKRGGTVSFASWSAPEEKFNPLFSSSVYDGYVWVPMFDGLFYLDDQGFTSRPALAQWWEISPDGLNYIFHLRRGVRFHDGEPLTAEDVRFTFEVVTHPDYQGPSNIGYDSLVGYDEYHSGKAEHISGIKVLDPYTIQFTLKETYAPFWYSLGLPILPKHLYCPESSMNACSVPVKDMSTARDPFRLNPIGTGPFKWSSYLSGQFYLLEANDDYYLGRPYIDRFLVKVLDQSTSTAQLETGAVDLGMLTRNDIKSIQKAANVRVIEYPSLVVQTLGMRATMAPFDDVKVRQAVNWAIDKQALVNDLLEGHGSMMYAPIHPMMWAYTEDLQKYGYNPEKAKQLLEEAGWKLGSGGVRYKNGQPLKVELLYPSGNPVRMASAPVIQNWLKAVGFDVQLSRVDFPTLLDKVITSRTAQAWLIGWVWGNPDPDPSSQFMKKYIGPDNNNYWEWWTPRSEELLAAGLRTTDIEKRTQIYQEWSRLYMEEGPAVMLYSPNDIYGVNKRVHNFRPLPIAMGELWNIWEWWVE